MVIDLSVDRIVDFFDFCTVELAHHLEGGAGEYSVLGVPVGMARSC